MTEPAPTKPSLRHWLGTDDQGHDVVALVIYGFRISVIFGLVLTTCSSVIGIMAGAVQGYFGGKIDSLVMRLINTIMALPSILLALCSRS